MKLSLEVLIRLGLKMGSLASRQRGGRATTVEKTVQSMSAVAAHGECSAQKFRGRQECRTEVSGERCGYFSMVSLQVAT
ncbi:hypothetical protein TNIN_489241 [Trichonephila inaurata madagascariensis]|uniref:Uncharacterized protein n=1 Tax=Trichonephila inaurata madagascariensis TaxID=2747483 RepID=A0A8X6XY30_9ARAC|nr:hypothetical protein TNIN_489241 [Trichonephila inaurata madagascariensis]